MRHFRIKPALGLVISLLIAVTAARTGMTAQPPSEYEVKAALLLKLAKFVSWPAASEGREQFGLCVAGNDKFKDALEPLRKQRVRNRPVVIERLTEGSGVPERCDLLYIAESDRHKIASLLRDLRGRPLLTVGEHAAFARSGGMVALQTRNRRVGFEINLDTSQSSGLVVSSQLLQLASVISSSNKGASL